MDEIIISRKSDLKALLREIILDVEAEKKRNDPSTLYTINRVAKRLGKSHTYIKNLVTSGILKTTEDGLIPSQEVEKYLRNIN